MFRVPDHQEGTAVTDATTRAHEAEADTDARQWEYTTYAPVGETCPGCGQPIQSLDVCRRGMLARRDTPPLIAYWHFACATQKRA